MLRKKNMDSNDQFGSGALCLSVVLKKPDHVYWALFCVPVQHIARLFSAAQQLATTTKATDRTTEQPKYEKKKKTE